MGAYGDVTIMAERKGERKSLSTLFLLTILNGAKGDYPYRIVIELSLNSHRKFTISKDSRARMSYLCLEDSVNVLLVSSELSRSCDKSYVQC